MVNVPPSSCKCKFCGEDMIRDDVDFNFKGNFNIDWICEICKLTCSQKYRFGKIYKEDWFNDEGVLIETSRKWTKCYNPYVV